MGLYMYCTVQEFRVEHKEQIFSRVRNHTAFYFVHRLILCTLRYMYSLSFVSSPIPPLSLQDPTPSEADKKKKKPVFKFRKLKRRKSSKTPTLETAEAGAAEATPMPTVNGENREEEDKLPRGECVH